MAKAREIPGLDWRDPYRTAAAKVVRVRAEELFEQSHDVLDMDNIERVHDMRVASRRLRAVLEIFAPCFPEREYRGVLRDVKRLADALGERRDPDVQLDAMTRFAAAAAVEDRSGVEVVLARLRSEQREGNVALAEALEEIERSDLRGRLLALCAHTDPAATAAIEDQIGGAR